MKNKNLWMIVLLPCLLACKTPQTAPQAIALSEQSKEDRLDMIVAQSLQYKTFSANVNCSVEMGDGKSISADGQLKMIDNKAIMLSLRIPLLGTEAFRATITPEQIVVIDRLHKHYLSESMTDLQKQAPFEFDFYSFQALLSNRLFVAGKSNLSRDDYSSFVLQEDSFHVFIENRDKYGARYAFTSDYTSRIQSVRMYKERSDAEISCAYSDFGLTEDKRLFPQNMKIQFETSDKKFALELQFKKIILDTAFEIDANSPAKYKKMEIKNFLQ